MSDTIRHIVIGNGAAGNSAAERLRQNDPNCSITLISAERHVHYSRVALPRFVRGQITADKVMMRTRESYVKANIDLRLSVRILAVDAYRKTVTCDDGAVIAFDRLLIATGGRPRPSPWQDPCDERRNLTFQTLDDAQKIIEYSENAKHVLVVGGGFIGYELAESIAFRKSAKVTWLMRGSRFLPHVLDASAGALCQNLAAEAGVDVLTEDGVETVDAHGGRYIVTTKSGRRLDVDFIAQGIGIDYYTDPAISAGLTAEPGIRTNSRLETAVGGIYAAGDIAMIQNARTGRYLQTGAWDSATAQGRAAADNMSGADQPYFEVPTYTTSFFSSTLAVLGDVHAVGGTGTRITFESDGRDYRQFHIAEGRLIGAVIIGSPKGRKRFIEIIRDQAPLPIDFMKMRELVPA